MLDQFGRSINYLRISITDRCNLRCRYCMPDGVKLVTHGELLRYEELLHIAKLAISLGITRFKITGGEPLARRNCVDFIAKLKALPGTEQVTMTTNGILLDSCLDELLSAGLDGVNISLDTMEPSQYQSLTGNCLKSVPDFMALLRRCTQQGLHTKINAVLLEETREDILSLASLAAQLPVDVRFIELMPIGEGVFTPGFSPDAALELLKKQWPDLHPTAERRGNGPAHYYASDALRGKIGVIDAVSHSFCNQCNRVRLTSTGQLKPCLCYDTAVDLRTVLRSGASDDTLQTVMEQAIFAKPRAHCFSSRNEITEYKGMSQIGG